MKYNFSFNGAPGIVAEGEYSGGEHKINYTLDNEKYFLSVKKGRVYHRCMGDGGLQLEFLENGKCEGSIRCGGYVAPFSIKCREMKVKISEEGFDVLVVFNWDEEPYREVRITAEVAYDKK